MIRVKRKPALWIVAPVAAIALAFGISSVAFAHAMPVKTFPGDGAVLTTAPTQVSMDTGEGMSTKPGDSVLIVSNSIGNVTTTPGTVDATGQHISVPLPTGLAVGVYTVRWFTVSSDDGEAASGSWTFTYDPSKTASAGTQPLVATDTPTAVATTAPAATATAAAAGATAPRAATPAPALTPSAPRTGNAGLLGAGSVWGPGMLLIAALVATSVVGVRWAVRR